MIALIAVPMFVGALSGIAALIYRYTRMQTNIAEWMVTLCALGVVIGICKSVFGRRLEQDQRLMILSIAASVLMVIGNLWGWSICKRLEFGPGIKRWLLMVTGWIGAFGVLLLVPAAMLTIALMTQDHAPPSVKDAVFRFYLYGTICALPAISVEIYARGVKSRFEEDARD